MTVKLVVDSREPLYIQQELRRKYPTTTVKTLKYGDYRIKGDDITLVLERKTVTDFQGSWHSGRLTRQIADLIEHCQRPALIFENDRGDYHKESDISTVYKYIETLSYQLTVVETCSRWHTINHILNLIKKIDAGAIQTITVSKTEIVKVGGIYERMLTAIPGISVVKANQIATEYPTLRDFVSYIEETYDYSKDEYETKAKWNEYRWFSCIDGVGEKIGKRVENMVMTGKW